MKITNNLYILNKYSKKIRDAEKWLKEYLNKFINNSEINFYYDDLQHNKSEKFINLINELSQFYDFKYEVTKETLFPKLNGNIFSYNTVSEWCDSIRILLSIAKDYKNKHQIYWCENLELEYFGNEAIYWYCNTFGEEIYDYFKENNYKYNEIKKIYEKIENIFEFINFLHDLLRQLNVIKNDFYKFKDKMLSLSCDKPIGYHKIGESENFFLLFEIEDNTFHLPTRLKEKEIILKNIKKLNDIDDIISAEITKETDVSLGDSIKIIKQFEDVSPNELFYENWQIGFAS